MPSDIPCDVDRFAATIDQILGEVADSCGKEIEKAVRKSVRKGAKDLRESKTEGIGRHPWSEKYRKGFASHVDRDGLNTVGEVGNKNKPGLVHLLEKGHLTLTSRRTQAYPHMEPAFRDMEEDFAEEAYKALGKAVR